MNTTTDWVKRIYHLKTSDGTEYRVEAAVFLEQREHRERSEHFGTPCTETVGEVTATVEGWQSVPECDWMDELELDRLVKQEVEEDFF